MANRTDVQARNVHGTNPQYLVEKILRAKIYDCRYWKEFCFGLSAESLVDQAVILDGVGGAYGGSLKPTKFICLVLKMLQLQPEKDIVIEFIKNWDYKYVRLLGAFYLRLIGSPVDIHEYLEPLYNDFRKVRVRQRDGSYTLSTVDQVIDEMLVQDHLFEITLPRIPKRTALEAQGKLQLRQSQLAELDVGDAPLLLENEAPEEPIKSAEQPTQSTRSRSREPRRTRSRSRERSRRSRSGSRSREHRRYRSRSRDRHDRHHRSRSRSRDRHRDRRRSRSYERRRHSRSRERVRSRSPSRDDDARRKHKRSVSPRGDEPPKVKKAAAPAKVDKYAEENALRAKLGIKPLRDE